MLFAATSKPDPEMQTVLDALASLGGKPIETLSPAGAVLGLVDRTANRHAAIAERGPRHRERVERAKRDYHGDYSD